MLMRVRNSRPKRHEQNILPLTNIVFLLLIFFMLAGRLAAPDPFGVTPPESAGAGAPAPRTLTVWVAADGRLALDGAELGVDAVVSAVSDRLSTDPDMPVEIRADAAVEAVRLIALIERLNGSGVQQLQLMTVPRLR